MASKNQALAFLKTVAAENSTPAWKHLDWRSVVERIRDLVLGPTLLSQAGLNACGPAAFFKIWLERDPYGVAIFAYQLLKSGAATIGPINVAPRDVLLAQDYNAVKS